MTGSKCCKTVLCLLALILCTAVGAIDSNNNNNNNTPLSEAAALLLQNKKFQSDSSSLQVKPDGGFDFSWKPKDAAIRSSSSNKSFIAMPVNTAVMMISSLTCWLYASWMALMTPHPNLKLPLRHDILTFLQAVALPVPILVSAFAALSDSTNDAILHRRLVLGIGTMSLWTGASVFFGKTFSLGYDLFSKETRYAVGIVELAIAIWCFGSWAQSVGRKHLGTRLVRGSVGSILSLLSCTNNNNNKALDNPDDIKSNDLALYTASTMGLLGLSMLPMLTSFPTATIPSILGKRFSRAACGVFFLASVEAYCVRDACFKGNKMNKSIATLRRGLAIGTIGHLLLVVGKIVGIDGGGLLISGDGLWEFYPSMVNASRAATTLMLTTLFITAFACTR